MSHEHPVGRHWVYPRFDESTVGALRATGAPPAAYSEEEASDLSATLHTSTLPARSRQFGAGDVVLYPGAASDLYQVVAGLVRLHTVDDDGFGATLRYVKPGGYFGEEALTGRQRRYFADAVTDSTVSAFDPRHLAGPDMRALAIDLALAMDRMNRALLRLAGKPLKARVAAELLELADSALASRSVEGVATIRMTHDELAAAVGSVRETVTKVIGELVRAGALKAGYAKLSIKDAGLLAEIAGP